MAPYYGDLPLFETSDLPCLTLSTDTIYLRMVMSCEVLRCFNPGSLFDLLRLAVSVVELQS